MFFNIFKTSCDACGHKINVEKHKNSRKKHKSITLTNISFNYGPVANYMVDNLKMCSSITRKYYFNPKYNRTLWRKKKQISNFNMVRVLP